MRNSIDSEKFRRPIVAFLFSIATIGLGQLYSTRHKRALLLYGAFLVFWFLYASTPVTYSFAGFLVAIIAATALGVFQVADAWRTAKRAGTVRLRWYNRWFVYVLIVAVNQLVVLPHLPEVLPVPVKGYRIPTSGMEPALLVGDHLVADRVRYQKGEPRRGDIVVFSSPGEPSKDCIKRVIGLPGETVEIRGMQVFINGAPLDDPWGVYRVPSSSGDMGPVNVPAGAYFMLGDNRNNSYDSRFWGCVRRGSIKGKALYIYWAKGKGRIGMRIH